MQLNSQFDYQEFLKNSWQKTPKILRNFLSYEQLITPDELAGLACESFAESRLIRKNPPKNVEHGPFLEELFEELPSDSKKVEEIYYKPGKFLNASLDKASEENERNYFKIKAKKNGEEIVIVQIAGLIARRIVCEVEQGQELKQGDRVGMIRFGSRVDIYFKNKKVLAKLGQNVIAGESLLASE